MLFADVAVLTAHTASSATTHQPLCRHMKRVWPQHQSKKDEHHGPRHQYDPNNSIGYYTLEMVEDLTYLGSTIFSNLSLDAKLKTRIGKAAAAMAALQ